MTGRSRRMIIGIVDDDPFGSKGIQIELSKSGKLRNLDVKSAARPTVFELLEFFDAHDIRPEVIILDLFLQDGSTVTENVLTINKLDIPVVVLSTQPSIEKARQAFAAGAAGVCRKQMEPDDLFDVILKAISHEPIQNKEFAIAISSDEGFVDAKLSAREREALQYSAMGYSATEVGELMVPPISGGTVKKNLARIRAKYQSVGRDARTYHDLRKRAYEDGYISYQKFLESLGEDPFGSAAMR